MSIYQRKAGKPDIFETAPHQSIPNSLSEIETAIRDGNRQYAYELSLQATLLEPENVDCWFVRATLAPSLEERVICVNRLNELQPGHGDRHNVAFFALKDSLDHDPFLAYLEETQELYRAINADHVVFSIPKKRTSASASPLEESSELRAAQRFLVLAILGLLVAGIGTVLFAPLAAVMAVRAAQTTSPAVRLGAVISFVIGALLFLVGVLFVFLFAVHWTG